MSEYPSNPRVFDDWTSVVIVVGHYGVGKTNFSLNVAVDAARAGRAVTLVDLDIVNPYFRSSDYPDVLQGAGIRLIAPEFARTALDTPSVSGRIDVAVEEARNEPNRLIIFDVGGDDAGATALGRFASTIAAGPYTMLYVVNALREQVLEPSEALDVLDEIQQQAHLQATAIVNNTHLKEQTTDEHIERGRAYAQAVSEGAKLPIACTTLPPESVHPVHSVKNQTLACDSDYFVQVYVKTPWDVG